MDGKAPVNQTSPPRTQVKKENEEEIKEFAETAMNELLGWYGYERLELRRWAASRARDGSSPEQASEQKNKDECSWCNKTITSESGALQQSGATFCSELCFSQSRRANFKRAKTCDWCRHVRHTVAYVDFQDGATQLQFCSDKCLNQYKMHIFCRETQAHLDLNPHLVSASSTSNLITPELWLKNCKSRSVSPNSERSGSPEKNTEKSEPKTQKSPLPLITVAPPAKLMKQKQTDVQKSPEAKKDVKNKMNLRKRRTSKSSATTQRQRTSTPKAQDLRMCSPEDSPPGNIINDIHSPPQINHHPPPPPFNPMFMPPPMFMDSPHRHPGMMPPRMPFMPRMPMPERPPQNFPTLGQAPPVTVLVPYPVILPIPIPIPIPIPLSSFLQAHASKVKTESTEETELPLDFTMSNKRDETEEPAQNVTEEIIAENTDPGSNESNERIAVEETPESNAEQTLPKFKITRVGNKMAKIVTKPREQSECTRPLRKRRRLVEVANEDEALIPKSRKTVEV